MRPRFSRSAAPGAPSPQHVQAGPSLGRLCPRQDPFVQSLPWPESHCARPVLGAMQGIAVTLRPRSKSGPWPLTAGDVTVGPQITGPAAVLPLRNHGPCNAARSSLRGPRTPPRGGPARKQAPPCSNKAGATRMRCETHDAASGTTQQIVMPARSPALRPSSIGSLPSTPTLDQLAMP